MGLSSVAVVVFMPIFGSLVDRVGRLPVLRGGFLAMAFLASAFALFDSLSWALYALRFGQGIAFAAAYTAANVLAADVAPPERVAQTLGRFGMATLLTHALGPGLGEWVSARHGFAVMFLDCGALALVALAASLALREPPARGGAAPAGAGSLRAVAWPFACLALSGVGFGAALAFMPLHVPRVTAFFTTYVGAALVVRGAFGHLGDRHPRHRVAAPALLGFGVAIALGAFVRSTVQLGLVGAAFGACHGLYFPTLAALALDRAAAARGRAVAGIHVAFNVGMAAGGVGLGAVAKAWGTGAALVAAGACAVLAAVLVGIGGARGGPPSAG